MTRSDFEPSVTAAELDGLMELSDRLDASRPVPSAVFRGALGRAIVVRRPPPRGLHIRVLACLASGTALLLVAALGVSGAGPLEPAPPGSGSQTASVSP